MRLVRTAILCILSIGAGSSFAQLPNMLDSVLTLYPNLHRDAKRSISTEKSDLNNPLGILAQNLRQSTYRTQNCEPTSTDAPGLWVLFEDEYFRYHEQELWRTHASGLVEVDLQEEDRQLRNTHRILNKLEKASAYARNIIQTLQYSENRFVIEITTSFSSYMLLPLPNGQKGMLNNNAYAFQIIDSKQLLVDYAPFDKIGSGATIRWNPSHRLIRLAHELSHAYDANFGLLDDRLRMINEHMIQAREIRAVYHENMIRGEMHKVLRSSASGHMVMLVDGKPYTYPLPVCASI